jgi:hypothetical protein
MIFAAPRDNPGRFPEIIGVVVTLPGTVTNSIGGWSLVCSNVRTLIGPL